jgi:hypothetical protein
MTEWYHATPYYDDEIPDIYTPVLDSSDWLWLDEFNANTYQMLFASTPSSPSSYLSNLNAYAALSAYPNATTAEYSNPQGFYTGTLGYLEILSISTGSNYLTSTGGGTTSATGTYAFDLGSVTISATPSNGYMFAYWWNITNTAYIGDSNPLTISGPWNPENPDEPFYLAADFEPCATLTISASITVPNLTFTIVGINEFGAGSGATIDGSGSVVLQQGSAREYTITVSPTEEIVQYRSGGITFSDIWYFDYWSNSYGSSATITITLSANTSLTAYYTYEVTHGPTPV